MNWRISKMMNDIEKIIKSKYKYKTIDNDGVKLLFLDNETILAIIINKKNVFKINRKQFYRIDDELLPYGFLLIDSTQKNMYFMKYKEPNNQLRYAFDSTKKDEIYFGKEILQNKIKLNELLSNIEKIEKM